MVPALGIALFTFFNINNDAEINIIAPQTINIRANIVFITLSSSVTFAYDNITTAAANAFIKIAKDNAVLILVLTLSLSIANNIAPNMPITSDIITNDFNTPLFISFDWLNINTAAASAFIRTAKLKTVTMLDSTCNVSSKNKIAPIITKTPDII